jgi:peptidylprolyl isomerase
MARNLHLRRFFTILFLLIASATSVASQDVAARMGQTDVKLDEIEAFLKTLGEREAIVRSDPALISQAVRLYLTNRAILKDAVDKKWDAEPSVKSQIQAAQDAVIVESYLQKEAKLPEGFPSDADVQSFYNANAQALFVPRQFQIAQIFIAAPKDTDAAKKEEGAKKLAAVQGKLKAPNADFAAIAKAESDAKATAERGGELGWVLETQLRPELAEKVATLPKGGVTEAVQLEDGYHILKLLDTRSAGPLPLEEVRPQIVARLQQQALAQARRAFVAQTLDRSPIILNEFVLAKLVQEATPQAAAAQPAAEQPKPAAAQARPAAAAATTRPAQTR